MKSTIKCLLVITLFFSTTVFTYADGDQEGGGRCQTCMITDEGQNHADNSQTDIESESESPKTNKTENSDEELIKLFKKWLNSLFG